MSFEPPRGRGGPQVIRRPTTARLGGPPPWSHLGAHERTLDTADLIGRLTAFEAGFDDRGQPAQNESAVLVAIYDHAGEPYVVLTRRSPHLRSHTHEVAFPGGRRDPDDVDVVATALREAQEEIALDPELVQPIGRLDSFVTVGSNSCVTPIVATLEGRPTSLVANPDEVEVILHVRLAELLEDIVWREELWQRDAGPWFPVTFFELHGDTVWGATANMLRQLLTIATDPV